MDFPISGRTSVPPAYLADQQKPSTAAAESTVLPTSLSVDEARNAARTALEPREKTAIIRALLANPPASAEALNLAAQIAATALAGYSDARDMLDPALDQTP